MPTKQEITRSQLTRTTVSIAAPPVHSTSANTAVVDSPGWLKYAKDSVATIQSLATIAALILGAWWVLRRRRPYPRANFTHIVTHVPLNSELNLVRLAVAIENIGEVLVKLDQSAAGIQQVVPVPDAVRPSLAARATLVGSSQSEIEWPFLDARRRDWKGRYIEPGETSAFHFELFIPANIRWILVYSYFRNVKKPGDQGWNTSTLHEIKSTADTVV